MNDLVPVSPGWFQAARQELGSEILLLFEGYPYSGFARFGATGQIEFPPYLSNVELDCRLFWDVRVFGSLGEWHAWKICSNWNWRSYSHDTLQAGCITPISQDYPMWGTKTKREGNWTCCYENRGTEVWLPIALTDFNLPVRLRMLLLLSVESETGLVGVMDTVVCGVTWRKHHE